MRLPCYCTLLLTTSFPPGFVGWLGLFTLTRGRSFASFTTRVLEFPPSMGGCKGGFSSTLRLLHKQVLINRESLYYFIPLVLIHIKERIILRYLNIPNHNRAVTGRLIHQPQEALRIHSIPQPHIYLQPHRPTRLLTSTRCKFPPFMGGRKGGFRVLSPT